VSEHALSVRTAAPQARAAPITLQRSCACEQTGESCSRCADKRHALQRLAAPGTLPAGLPSSLGAVLRSGGHLLPEPTRLQMESSFNHDFSGVRIHSDTNAMRSAAEVSARAYTVGKHIVLGGMAPDLRAEAGKRLLGHELAHVVQQSHGSGVANGIDPDAGLEAEAQRAGDEVAAGRQARIARYSPIALARDALPGAPAAGEVMYEFPFKGGTKRVTKAEFERLLRTELNGVKDLAKNGKQTQHRLLDEYQGGVESLSDVWHKPKSLIGIAADIWGGTTPPWIGMWDHPVFAADLGLADVGRGDFNKAGRHLGVALEDYRTAETEFKVYIQKTTAGAEKLADQLGTVRDVSFTIALASGAALAAPFVASGVAALGVTGVGATALTAVGTAGVVGTGGVVLGGGSEALASKVNTGSVDWKATKHAAAKWGKQGAITGLTAGLGQALQGAGAAARIGQPLIQQALRRCVTEAGVNIVGEITTDVLDKIVPSESAAEVAEAKSKHLIPSKARAALTGCVSGALGVPAAKLKGAASAIADKAIGAGVAFADAKLQGMSNKEAALAAAQATLTSAAVDHGQKGTDKAKATRASKAGASSGGEHAPPAHSTPESDAAKAAHAPPAPQVNAAKTAHPEPAAHADAAKAAGTEAAPHAAVKTGHPDQAAHPGAAKSAHPEGGPHSDPTKAEQKSPSLRPKESAAPQPEHAVDPATATAKQDLPEGHKAVVTPAGVAKCSPGPCPVIHLEYKKELDAHPELAAENKRIQAKRRKNPGAAAAEAAALIKRLDKIRADAAKKPPVSVHGSATPGAHETLVGRSKSQMRRKALQIIRADPNHPLRFLLGKKGGFKSQRGLKHSALANRPDLVQMGHIRSDKLGRDEHVMLQGAWENQFNNVTVEQSHLGGAVLDQPAVSIGGIAVDLKTAKFWEAEGFLAPGTVASAPRVKIPALEEAE